MPERGENDSFLRWKGCKGRKKIIKYLVPPGHLFELVVVAQGHKYTNVTFKFSPHLRSVIPEGRGSLLTGRRAAPSRSSGADGAAGSGRPLSTLLWVEVGLLYMSSRSGYTFWKSIPF